MNEQELQQLLQDPQFWSWLSLKTGQPEEECQQMVSQMLLSGDLLAQLQFMQIVLQYMQETLVQAARFGMKVNYLKQLYGNCPAGTELQYYKAGGRICKKCVKKQYGGITPSNPVDEFKKEHKVNFIKPLSKAVGGTVDQPAKYNKKLCKKNAKGGTVVKGQEGLISKSIMNFLGKLESPVAERLYKYAEKLPDKYKDRFYKLLENLQGLIKNMDHADKFIKGFLKESNKNVNDLNRYQEWLYNLYLSGKMSEGKYHDLFQASEDRAFDAGYDKEGGVIEGQQGFDSLDLINALKKALPTHTLGTIKNIVSKLEINGDTTKIRKIFGEDVENEVGKILKKIPHLKPFERPSVEHLPYRPGIDDALPRHLPYRPGIDDALPEYLLYRNGGQISTIDRIRTAMFYKRKRG